MPRKKKTEEMATKITNEFVFCGLRKCIHTECLRHNVNTPLNKLILRKDFNPDKDWKCKDIL